MTVNEILTPEKLKRLFPNNKKLGEWCRSFNYFLPKYEIETVPRIAAFMAQCGHESQDLTVLRENLNYRWDTLCKVFPKYFPNESIARHYANLPNKKEAIANKVYANRMGNGDEQSGDGFKYSGKGIIQLTGKDNYQRFADFSGKQLQEIPGYITTFDGAVESACWFWKLNNLNSLADCGDISRMTKLINGGYIGLSDRLNRFELYKIILNS